MNKIEPTSVHGRWNASFTAKLVLLAIVVDVIANVATKAISGRVGVQPR